MLGEPTMTEPRTVSCYLYVKRPFSDVRALLIRGPLPLLQRATTSATARTQSLATSLRVDMASVSLSVDVRTHVRHVRDELVSGALPGLCVEFAWEAVNHPSLFPSMLADLIVWPLSARETQIEMQGSYWIPMGRLGEVFDAAIGHRIAEASALCFLGDLLEQICSELPQPS
jgi:hypothetical protein